MKNYDTLSQAMKSLRSDGYIYDFNLEKRHVSCRQLDRKFGPNELEITEVYRFEGMSNPSDMSILYAIETHAGLKGLMVETYGTYAEEIDPLLYQKLQTAYRDSLNIRL